MRKLASIAVTAGLLVTLSACSTPTGPFAGCEPTGNAALVTADGAFGEDPKTDFPTPLVAKSADLAVVLEGDGTRLTDDGAVDAIISIYDGETGEVLQDTQGGSYVGITIRSFVDGQFPFTTALSCATEGSRVVTTGTNTQLFGSTGLGLPEGTTLVVVSDIEKVYPGKANGADQLAQPGFPSIALAPDGRPGFTFPGGEPPAEARSMALKGGNGATVAADDTIIANFTGITWGGSEPFLSSFDDQAPTALPLGEGLPEALSSAIVGQKVGSQVIVILPPGEGFAAGQAPAGVADDDTLVFVVDILAIG